MKKILTFLLLALFCFTASINAFAADIKYIFDEVDLFSDIELKSLNDVANVKSNTNNVDIIYGYIDDDLDTYFNKTSFGNKDNAVIMLENDDYWNIYTKGTTSQYINDAQKESLRTAYDSKNTPYDGVLAFFEAVDVLVRANSQNDTLTNSTTTGSSVTNNTNTSKKLPRIVDDADLIGNSDEKLLLSKLDEISERQKLDVVIVTVDSIGTKSAEAFADDFYDENGYGFGSKYDGILLLISMEDRDWHISTCGYGKTAFTDAGLEYLSEKFLPDLSNGNYEVAFNIFAEQCDEFITQARNGEPYDNEELPKGEFKFGSRLVISFVIGLVVALISTSTMKGQLKSVAMQKNATNYVRKGSMKVTESNDFFLYRTVNRRAKPKQSSSSSSSRSSSHRSSSGRSHGGKGGKF